MDSSFFFSSYDAAIGFFTLLGILFFMFNRKFKLHQENKIIAFSSSSSSSSLPLSSPLSRQSQNWKHHVFPSFHGEDVRKTFLTHILKEFRRKGIDPFIDNDIERNKSIGHELIEAIRGSKIAVVLLSRNYASSSWCLNELVEIMKFKEELGRIVITIFYEVDPSDVKKQMGDFGKAFKKACKGKTKEEIMRWRKALEGVATIAGYHSSNWNNEAVMIEKIATDVSNMLNISTPSKDFDGLVGMRDHMERMDLLLRLDLEEVRMIGIWGPSGIGKTTIARFLFNKVSSNFQLSTIMVNIKGCYPRPCLDEYNAQLQLQNQMLSQIINQKDIDIPHLGVAQERLKEKKVFLVLDDVDRLGQIVALAKETQWFGPGSRIIITTEDLRVLKAHGINHIYRVDFPSANEALEIFCINAFGQKSPKPGFTELAYEVTFLAGKLPLGLKVMGSYFRGMSKQEWTRSLPKLRSRLDGEIESILKFSYDALFDEDKELFLHIACFFNNQRFEKVEEHLAKRFLDVRQGFHVLVEKSLISIEKGWVTMHSLLMQLGREIVRKQSVHEPGQRQFLDHSRDICEVFSDDTPGSRSVVGITLNLYEITEELNISERVFEGMTNLQFLRFHYGFKHMVNGNNRYLLYGLNHQFRKLRLLEWVYFPLTYLPSIFNTKFLIELNMRYSKLEKLWEGIQPLSNIKWIDLSDSRNLKELPDLSTAINLLELSLRDCSSLVEIPSSIGNATKLKSLNLNYCSSLVKVPFSIGNCHNLENFFLSGCSSLVEIPSSIGNATKLKSLELNHCSSLVKVPSSIGNFHRLPILNMMGCSKLEILPRNINMESLWLLNLTDCSSLKSFPEISTSIEQLFLFGTAIKEVPLSIRSWSGLDILHMPYSENLKESPHAFDIITKLDVRDKGIQELGPWVKGCSFLRNLLLSGCRNLIALPELPGSLRWLDAENCESLERLDCSFNNPFISLVFANCFKLNQEARDHIIQTSSRRAAVLPGGEVPPYFTYRASEGSVTVKLNQKTLPTSSTFKACILLEYDDLYTEYDDDVDGEGAWVYCSITSKQNALTASGWNRHSLYPLLTGHLYTFEVKAKDITSGELVCMFELQPHSNSDAWKIKECGIFQLLEDEIFSDGDEDFESLDEDYESSDQVNQHYESFSGGDEYYESSDEYYEPSSSDEDY